MSRTPRTLADRYRRLLLCYPFEYRRTRGDEIVATLLDLAPPDRTRPTVREAANLVRHGLRCRLGRPNSRSVVIWAALTAIVWALFAGAFGTRLAWQTARPLPTTAEARELFSGMLGQDTTGNVGVDPAMFVIYGQPLGRDNLHLLFSIDASEYQQGRASVALNGAAEVNHQDLVDATRARLQANGWRLSDVIIRKRVDCTGCDESTLPRNAVFVARRGDDVLNVEISLGDNRPRTPKPGVADYDVETYAHVELTRASPSAVYPFGAAGVVLGAVVGWLVFGWASRRLDGRAGLLRTSSTVLFVVAMLLWCVPLVLGPPFMLEHHLSEPHPSWHPMWEWLALPGLVSLVAVGTGAALLVLGAAALPRRRASPGERVDVDVLGVG
jgi:hypothetical protein